MTVSVLLVEDTPQLRAVMVELLHSLGDFTVVAQLETEAQAKSWIDANPGGWQLAIVDLVLAQGTGIAVVARCRQASAHGKVVVFSDYATPSIRRHCLQLGADAVFQKGEEVQALAEYCAALAAGGSPPPSGSY